MCGIFFSNKSSVEFDSDQLKLRGPDSFQSLQTELGLFVHSNLITKPNNQHQPLQTSHGVLLYNGTQFDVNANDTGYIAHNLTEDWKQNIQFIQTLKGDFVIVWITDQHILMARDFGGNKCLWFSIDQTGISISNLESCVSTSANLAIKLKPNQCLILDRKSLSTVHHNRELFVFDHRPHVNDYDKIMSAFEKSVLKRWSPGTVVPLSAGMDSGAIAACLLHHDKNFLAASRIGHENFDILQARHQKLSNINNFLFADVDKLSLKLSSKHQSLIFLDQVGQVGFYIGQKVKSLGYKFLMSGNGGDELFSDYGWNGQKFTKSSQFGGIFPEDTSSIWPWVHDSSQPLEQSIIIEDLVYGQHGMDTRNPMLDIDVVQEWLNLSTHLKNQQYKGWLQQYLRIKNFPFNLDKKTLPIPADQRRACFENNRQKNRLYLEPIASFGNKA